MVTFTGGAILNALFGKVLKRVIKEVSLRELRWKIGSYFGSFLSCVCEGCVYHVL